MLIAIHGVKPYAHYYTWSEALCSRLIKETCSAKLFAIHGVKLYAHCYTRSEAICSLLYMK